MISLTHFKKCPSVLSIPKEIDLNSSLNFCTDTRKYHHPSFFVAIPGIKVNPLDVIENLLSQKCPLIVFQDDLINQSKVNDLKLKFPETVFMPVSDSVTFLQELSHHHINNWKNLNPKNTVFAISG